MEGLGPTESSIDPLLECPKPLPSTGSVVYIYLKIGSVPSKLGIWRSRVLCLWSSTLDSLSFCLWGCYPLRECVKADSMEPLLACGFP